MMQLSLIPALEASRFAPPDMGTQAAPRSGMAPVNRPTAAQVSYLKKLTRIKTDTQLVRYILRKLDKDSATTASAAKAILTKGDFAKVIEMEVSEKRWTL